MDERWLTDTQTEERYPLWTRGNAGDVFPEPVTPLFWTFYCEPALCKGVRDAYIRFGVVGWHEFEDPDNAHTFSCFGGYLYNPLSIVRLMGARMPGASVEAIDQAYFDDRPEVPAYVAEPWHESPVQSAKLVETATWVMTATELPELDAEKTFADYLRSSRPELTELPDPALLARARAVVPHLHQSFETGMRVSIGGSIGPSVLGQICEALGDPSLTIRLLSGIEVDSAKPSLAMWDLSRRVRSSTVLAKAFGAGTEGLLARLESDPSPEVAAFMSRFESFLDDFGSRGPKEWDLNAKVWELYPEVALVAIDRMRVSPDSQSPATRHDASVVERDRVLADIREKLSGDAETLATFEAALRSSQLFVGGRERYKTTCIKLVHEMRMCFVELGRRMVGRGVLDSPEQVFLLLASELDAFRHEPAEFSDLLRQREREYQALYRLEPPFVVNTTVPPLSTWPSRDDAKTTLAGQGERLTGTAGSGGVATGRACVILDPSDPGELEPGDVLIAPNTDPSWTPLFVASSAVVVNVGAAGSHAMIVSRDLGIPCVVSVADATTRIPNGATVTVDGNAGTVTVH